MIRAILLPKAGEAVLTTVEKEQLPLGDVLVDVAASTLNYKDALAITGKAPVVRSYPMVPGIDFAGTIADSSHPGLRAGDQVVLTGWGVGESRWGGLAAQARVPGDWLVPLPRAFTPQQAMAIGTAGFTAMLCLLRLEQLGVTPAQGPVLVTGAAGGVGSVAVALLARRGFEVAALTGRPAERPYLEGLGAREIVDRAEYAGPARPLAKERWGAGIDTVGGHVLANLLAATKRDGTVAACGLAGGLELPSSVAPFILRGVTLAGVDSVVAPMPLRHQAWDRLASDLDPELLAAMTTTIGLDEVIAAAPRIIAGQVRGRLVVDLTR